MTCLEAQSNIMAFVDKKLDDEHTKDFVRHMRHCKNCSEELEIYYTLIVGMRQLDNNEELSHNFKKDLDDELTRIDNRAKNVKRFKFSTFGIVFTIAVLGFFLFYSSILNKVYTIEQNMIKTEQGDYYFYNHLSKYIDICNDDVIVRYKELNKPREKSFYERVHSYNITHPVWANGELKEEVHE
ncbi:MAG: zf-HC2 domain-containing protein [Lachnospiraceae bacterium]|nr:zf-HC2 domain-containing protein [Lachnospiraceae bacterium]